MYKNIFSVSYNNLNLPFVFLNKRKAIRYGISVAKQNSCHVYIRMKPSRSKRFQDYIAITPKGAITLAYSGGGYIFPDKFTY
jgi:hypothetical protein